MTRLDWSQAFREYEAGLDRGVLYFGEEAIPWDGLVRVNEDPAVSDASPLYFEGVVFNLDQELNDFSARVEAFTYPYFLEDVVLALSDGRTLVSTTQDSDLPFGFSYRVKNNSGYSIHLVYNITATLETVIHKTLDDAMSLDPFTFVFYTTPVDVPNGRPSSHFIIDTSEIDDEKVIHVEELLYGTATYSPRLPSVADILSILNSGSGESD